MAKKTKRLKTLAQIGAGLGTAYLLSRMGESKAETIKENASVNQYDSVNINKLQNKVSNTETPTVLPPSQLEKNKAAEIAQDRARVNQYTQTRKKPPFGGIGSSRGAGDYDFNASTKNELIKRYGGGRGAGSYPPGMAEGGEVEIGKGKDYINDLL